MVINGAGRWRAVVTLAALVFAGLPDGVSARVLEVGPGKEFAAPSGAAAAAMDGDTVRIEPGIYIDCAVWGQNRLVIEATAPGVVLSEKTCAGKGIFVIDGRDVTIRGITFKGAKVRDNNGAGIRAQGGKLTVENSTFLENQMGMLATGVDDAVVLIRDSLFARNGCFPECPKANMHALYAGRHFALLRVERSEFVEQHDGHYVKSRALRTEIVDSVIHDGESGTGSYLIDIPDGGVLIARGNRMEKGRRAENWRAAIAIGEEQRERPPAEIVLENNTFTNLTPYRTMFVWNLSRANPVLRDNVLKGPVLPVGTGR